MRYIASLLILMLLIGTASANQGTITLYGTNASNTQSNLTRVGTNATVNVSAWAVGDATKTFTINVSDLSDTNNITLGNFTAGRIIEVKVNGTSYNAYLASAQGEIKFNRTQNNRNQTYTATPALNANYNLSWIAVNGVVNPYLPLTGGTMTGTLLGTTIGATYFANAAGTNMLGAGTGSISNVAINPATGVIYPLQVSTSRPAWSQSGLLANTTTQSLEFAGDNNQWVSLNHFRNVTYSDSGNLTGKAINTIYQNNNATPVMVSLSVVTDGAGTSAAECKVDITNPPSRLATRGTFAASEIESFSFIVPAMHYWSCTDTGGTGVTTFNSVMETQ